MRVNCNKNKIDWASASDVNVCWSRWGAEKEPKILGHFYCIIKSLNEALKSQNWAWDTGIKMEEYALFCNTLLEKAPRTARIDLQQFWAKIALVRPGIQTWPGRRECRHSTTCATTTALLPTFSMSTACLKILLPDRSDQLGLCFRYCTDQIFCSKPSNICVM